MVQVFRVWWFGFFAQILLCNGLIIVLGAYFSVSFHSSSDPLAHISTKSPNFVFFPPLFTLFIFLFSSKDLILIIFLSCLQMENLRNKYFLGFVILVIKLFESRKFRHLEVVIVLLITDFPFSYP